MLLGVCGNVSAAASSFSRAIHAIGAELNMHDFSIVNWEVVKALGTEASAEIPETQKPCAPESSCNLRDVDLVNLEGPEL